MRHKHCVFSAEYMQKAIWIHVECLLLLLFCIVLPSRVQTENFKKKWCVTAEDIIMGSMFFISICILKEGYFFSLDCFAHGLNLIFIFLCVCLEGLSLRQPDVTLKQEVVSLDFILQPSTLFKG